MSGVILQTGGVIYLTPYDVIFLLIALIVGLGVPIGLFIWFMESRHRASVESAMVNAETTALYVQTGMMANQNMATVNAINVNTATYQQMAQAEIMNSNKLTDAMVTFMNTVANAYAMSVQHNIDFENKLLHLVELQLGVQDIRQLMSDKVKASVVEGLKNPTVEITTQTPSTK